MSRLPNSTYRLWFISAVYGLLLVVGFLPLAIIVWLTVQLGPALNQPAFLRGLLEAGGQLFRLGQAVVEAGWQALGGLGELVGQQPAILGLLLVMLGIVFLWGGVYRQLTSPRRV